MAPARITERRTNFIMTRSHGTLQATEARRGGGGEGQLFSGNGEGHSFGNWRGGGLYSSQQLMTYAHIFS